MQLPAPAVALEAILAGLEWLLAELAAVLDEAPQNVREAVRDVCASLDRALKEEGLVPIAT